MAIARTARPCADATDVGCVQLPPLLSAHAVLQAPKATVFGGAAPGDSVEVCIPSAGWATGEQCGRGVADAEGRWRADLHEIHRGMAPVDVTVRQAHIKIVVTDVVVGGTFRGAAAAPLPSYHLTPPQTSVSSPANLWWRRQSPSTRQAQRGGTRRSASASFGCSCRPRPGTMPKRRSRSQAVGPSWPPAPTRWP